MWWSAMVLTQHSTRLSARTLSSLLRRGMHSTIPFRAPRLLRAPARTCGGRCEKTVGVRKGGCASEAQDDEVLVEGVLVSAVFVWVEIYVGEGATIGVF